MGKASGRRPTLSQKLNDNPAIIAMLIVFINGPLFFNQTAFLVRLRFIKKRHLRFGAKGTDLLGQAKRREEYIQLFPREC